MKTTLHPYARWILELRDHRRGVFVVLLAVGLVACLGLVSFSVDTGMVVLTKTRMQNTVDVAALAAANEITHAVETAGPNVSDVTAYAMEQARLKAAEIGQLNGVFIDPATDVEFGRRTLVPSTGQYTLTWGVTPANAVKVVARRTNDDTTLPDGKLPTMFASAFGADSISVRTEAVSYIESRDLALVLDFSSSMNDDSSYDVLATRNRAQLDANMEQIFNELDAVRDFGSMTFTPRWFSQSVTTGSKSGTAVFRNTTLDLTMSDPMSSVLLQFTNNSTETKSASGTTGSFSGSSSKTIYKATVTVPGTLAPASESSTVSGKTANVTFNNSTNNSIMITTNSNMTQVKLFYQGDTNTTTPTFSGTTSKTVAGNGLYVSKVQVKMGADWVTVNNPSGLTAPSTFGSTTLIFEASPTNVKASLELGAYPWASGSWSEFISYCQTDGQINSAGHRYKYGGACLVNYLLKNKYQYSQCNDLWRTSHYPFHSCKQGAQLFCTFLGDLGFGDEVGAVSYDVNSRREQTLDYDGFNIDLTSNPISGNFSAVSQIIGHRQAAHYSGNTNIGAGIYAGRLMLDASKRPGTRPTMLVMTDGLPTASDSGWTFPSDWDWDELFDYDGDGSADYTTTNSHARYGLMRAKEAVDAGYTIHTMTVGVGGDPTYMEAVAHLGGGITITIPGNQTVAEMESEVLAAFNRIAAFVPPAKLVKPE